MNIKLEVFQGQEAFDIIETDCVLTTWTRLAKESEKHVVLQRWEFVKTWYTHYQRKYQPLFFLGYDSDQEIIGILAMATHLKTGKVCVAGDQYAEYHGWLCEEMYEADFVYKCLRYLKHEYGANKWEINWLAPGTRTDFLNPEKLSKEGIYVELLSSEDPVWDLKNEKKLKKISKRANVKRSFKYFRQTGNFYLKRIHEVKNLRPLLEELAAQNDFKKEALYNMGGFKADPHSLNFLEDLLQYPEINHFSVLYLDDKPLAFNHALIEGEELCLASTSYNPAESRNSPGKLHLLELAKLCPEESIYSFDLTPGKDVYKSRFANSSRLVHKVKFHFSLRSKVKADIIKYLKRSTQLIFERANWDFSSLKYKIHDQLVKVRRMLSLGPGNTIRELGEWIYKEKSFRLFEVKNRRFGTGTYQLDPGWEFSENDFHDLLDYDEPEGYISRKGLFMECLERFGKGDKLYCLKNKGKLAALAWLRNGKYPIPLPGTNQEEKFPDSAFVIYGFREFGEDISNREVEALYEEMIQDLIHRGEEEIYVLENKEGQSNLSYQSYRKMKKQFDRRYVRILGIFHFFRSNTSKIPTQEGRFFTRISSVQAS